jgi:hypothetical protein
VTGSSTGMMMAEVTMKYALLIYVNPDTDRTVPPPPQAYPTWVDYIRAVKNSGQLVAAERLADTDTSTSVRVRGSERLLTDGPFAETKEHLLGFCLLDVPDIDTALNWAAKMPITHFGTVELRPIKDGDPWQAVLNEP